LPRIVLLHRCPQSVFMESIYVDLCFFTTPLGDDRSTFFMNVQHELRCFFEAVSEEFLEHERHVRHEIDGIVPHEHDPWPIVARRVLWVSTSDVERAFDNIGHTPIVSGCDMKQSAAS